MGFTANPPHQQGQRQAAPIGYGSQRHQRQEWGAMPPAPAACKDLSEGLLSCLGAQCNDEDFDKDLEQGPLLSVSNLTGVSPERAVRGVLLGELLGPG